MNFRLHCMRIKINTWKHWSYLKALEKGFIAIELDYEVALLACHRAVLCICPWFSIQMQEGQMHQTVNLVNQLLFHIKVLAYPAIFLLVLVILSSSQTPKCSLHQIPGPRLGEQAQTGVTTSLACFYLGVTFINQSLLLSEQNCFFHSLSKTIPQAY